MPNGAQKHAQSSAKQRVIIDDQNFYADTPPFPFDSQF
jgi:hypothetical protein